VTKVGATSAAHPPPRRAVSSEQVAPAHAADRLIEAPIVAGLVYVSYQFLSSMPFYPAAADAPSVGQREMLRVGKMTVKISIAVKVLVSISSLMLTLSNMPLARTFYENQPAPPQTLPTPTPLYSGSENTWEFWSHAELKGLDPWGDSSSGETDLIALYEKENTDTISFRLDLMDFQTASISPTYFAVDFKAGGNTHVAPDNDSILFDIEWDLMVAIAGTAFTLYDASFTELSAQLSATQMDSQLDLVAFTVSKTAFTGWDGNPFQMQTLVTDAGVTTELDRTEPVYTDATTGRGKLVLTFMNCLAGWGPSAVSWYDGYALLPDQRPGGRRGCRYLLDAVETYQLPLTFMDLIIDNQASDEYLHINQRFRDLASAGLLDALANTGYGHFMTWQPDDVDARAIEIATQIRQDLDLPMSSVYSPYEAMITPGDIQVIRDAGFEAIFGWDQYRYWFGWIEDWSDPDVVKADIESLRKPHLINGMPFVFHTSIGNYGGFVDDERWEEIDWDEQSEYAQYEGTDQGLDLWWRRILHDMAIDPDQEQFFTIGTDIGLVPWLFPDVVDWNFKWLASHPWIEVTTFTDILSRNWQVIDHGDLGLAADELLIQYPLDGDTHYNAYFPQFYYGGISDGHSPLIPAGEEIEAYYDYIPYLRDGQLIPSARIMGDDHTPGSIVYETLRNLRAAPDNDLTRLAWQAYLVGIWEQTFHAQTDYAGGEPEGDDWGGQYLHPHSKRTANKMMQVNKIVAAANWAADTATGSIPGSPQALALDLDLDGEDEYVLYNDQVYAVFENDGARLEFAFATSPQHGPVQLIAPEYQVYGRLGNYEQGEIGDLPTWNARPDAAFIEDVDGDYTLDYPLYQATIQNNTLVFTSIEHGITKTFTLVGDTIEAHYELAAPTDLEPAFGIVANLRNMFTVDWSENIEEIRIGNSYGWQISNGGLAFVSLPDRVTLLQSQSFTDSPARDEGMERENPDTYPAGHWFNYPQNSINTYADGSAGEFYVSLTLRADPLRMLFLPVVTKDD